MAMENDKAPMSTIKRLTAVGIGVCLLSAAVLAAALVAREDNNRLAGTALPPSSSETSTSTTRLDIRIVLVERLKDILRVRDRAFHDRNSGILEDVYTIDCPCLEGDRNAIRELISNNYRVVGGDTSIRVRRVEQVSKSLWLVVADFRSSALRIEARDGKLIREEPAGEELFQFSLSKPTGSAEWLLGRANAYREGSG